MVQLDTCLLQVSVNMANNELVAVNVMGHRKELKLNADLLRKSSYLLLIYSECFEWERGISHIMTHTKQALLHRLSV